jgi:hypothetical protein
MKFVVSNIYRCPNEPLLLRTILDIHARFRSVPNEAIKKALEKLTISTP